MAHDHEDHDHDHAPLAIARTRVAPETLKELDAAHPRLAEILGFCARYPELTESDKADLLAQHETMATEGPWLPGFHAEGDLCSVCGEPTVALFEDALKEGGSIPWAAFASDLPTHPACMAEFPGKFPRLAPRTLDQARRATMDDLDRPSAATATFFRFDLLKHGEFELVDWANSVNEANPGMSRTAARDVEKCIRWVHARAFH